MIFHGSRILALLTAFAAALCGAPAAHAAEPVLLVDSMTLSPDGSTLVFAWRGDLWQGSSAGGSITRLTSHPGTDTDPKFSPDGKHIAFISDRDGRGRQIYTIPLEGGVPTRITTHTEGFNLEGWYPDGQSLLVSATRDHFWRRGQRFFRQYLDAERAPELLFDGYGNNGSLSADGKHLLFTREGVRSTRKRYHGSQASQIWLHEIGTDEFRKLTTHENGERHPLWLPENATMIYTSQESGTFNLHRRTIGTSMTWQLTSFEDDGVQSPTISRDGSTVVFRRLADLYSMQLGSEELPKKLEFTYDGDAWIDPLLRTTLTSATSAAFTDDAREIVFIAGGDVWVMDTELREPVRITSTPEEERDPVFSPDYGSIVFVSDTGGQTDLWSATRGDEDAYWWQQSEFRLERLTRDPQPEDNPRFTPDGRIAYDRLRGDLWLMDADGKNAERVLESWNAAQYDFSPDGKWIVYVVSDNDFNRDVWVKPLDGSLEPFNISRHPDNESNPTWSPDGNAIAFTGRRYDDEIDLYYVWLRKDSDEETSRDRKLEKAIKKMSGRKSGTNDKNDKNDKKQGKADAGGGKKNGADTPAAAATATPAAADAVSGTWEGSLTGPPPLPGGGLPFTLTLTLSADGSVAGDMEAEGMGSTPIGDGAFDAASSKLTFTVDSPQGATTVEATVNGNEMSGKWSLAIGLAGTLTASRAAVEPTGAAGGIAAGEAEASDKKDGKDAGDKAEVVIDFEGLEDRIRRVRIPNSSESSLLWSPDSKKLAFRASLNGKSGLYTIEFPDKLTPKLLTSSVGSGGRWLKDGNQIVWLLGGKPTSTTASGKSTSYSFTARHEADRYAKHSAAFDIAWRTMRDRFYDERLGNNNWDAIGRKYRALAGKCATTQELAVVVNHMLGELNGSHLGFSARGGRPTPPSSGWSDTTAHLGARFDDSFRGPGIRVRDVIAGTPAARADSLLEAGDVILSIDGVSVDPSLDLAPLMTGRLDRDILLAVAGADGEERTVTIRPTTFRAARSRLYDTWVKANQKAVEEASDGKLGYLHVRGMNWSSFQKFDAELYKIGHGKDGLIIDVRENGGGSTTDHLLTSLTQPRHAITVPRGGGRGYPHDRRVYATWHKPIIVLCNQNSFSNAEIFSHAIKTLGRGQVVGVPTAGGVISTGGTSVMDIGFLRLPFRGWYLLDGEDMELNGCVPHHIVWPQPAELPAGVDRQLDKAVDVLLADVEEFLARPRPTLRKASERARQE